jgi:error-prone DNA polymerase
MGFYMPVTIVEDAKRHNLVVAPIDVIVSGWDCTLEPLTKVAAALPSAWGFDT